ncbi:hypothetical protein GS8_3048 [Geobacillus stearothermophilus]|uniref:Uncharacterized protein n=1 Tax=Geobacillus stearothermophilus TaxID=1422 RepID=A0ABQ7HBF2_GEOSE|nr:hypothetical protein GS8_3048 [Geobacillus stearothermophilus]
MFSAVCQRLSSFRDEQCVVILYVLYTMSRRIQRNFAQWNSVPQTV